MKRCLISILIVTALNVTIPANATQLLIEPVDSARVLADQLNSAELFVIESAGDWSRVVHTETGLVGWAKMPRATSNEDEESAADPENAENDDNFADDDDELEKDENDISGMVLAAR